MTLDTNAIFPELYATLGLSGLKNGASTFPLVLSSLCSHLDRVVQKNEKSMDVKRTKEIITVFNGLRAPELSIRMYIERIFKYSKCSPSCFVLANIYIDRFLQRPDVHLTSLNVHRLLITSVVIAAKFIDDAFFSNAYYAKVGGVSTREMNKLELNFLFSLDFRLQVSPETFGRYCIQLEREGTGVQVERPVQVCRPKDWTNKDDSKCQPPLHRYSY